MRKELLVVCPTCESKQVYHGQYHCDNCHTPMSPWKLAQQLQESRDKEFLEQLKGKNVQDG